MDIDCWNHCQIPEWMSVKNVFYVITFMNYKFIHDAICKMTKNTWIPLPPSYLSSITAAGCMGYLANNKKFGEIYWLTWLAWRFITLFSIWKICSLLATVKFFCYLMHHTMYQFVIHTCNNTKRILDSHSFRNLTVNYEVILLVNWWLEDFI